MMPLPFNTTSLQYFTKSHLILYYPSIKQFMRFCRKLLQCIIILVKNLFFFSFDILVLVPHTHTKLILFLSELIFRSSLSVFITHRLYTFNTSGYFVMWFDKFEVKKKNKNSCTRSTNTHTQSLPWLIDAVCIMRKCQMN